MDRGNLLQRVATALVLAPLLLALVLLAPQTVFAGVFLVVFLLAGDEWSRLAGIVSLPGRAAAAIALAALLAGAWWIMSAMPARAIWVPTAGLLWWGLAAAWVLGRWRLAQPLKLLAGILTLVPAWAALVQLHGFQHGPWLVLALLFIVWAADVGAFFAGHGFGRHKLAPEVSPGKTWEGVAGGLLLAAGVAALEAWLLDIALLPFVALAVMVVPVSIVGDLMESLVKRQAGVKDSSTLLPGHGGVLDRLDSLYAAGPAFVVGLGALGLAR